MHIPLYSPDSQPTFSRSKNFDCPQSSIPARVDPEDRRQQVPDCRDAIRTTANKSKGNNLDGNSTHRLLLSPWPCVTFSNTLLLYGASALFSPQDAAALYENTHILNRIVYFWRPCVFLRTWSSVSIRNCMYRVHVSIDFVLPLAKSNTAAVYLHGQIYEMDHIGSFFM